MMDKLLSFDIEITKVIPEGDEWCKHRPFGISVAATLASGDGAEELTLWYGRGRPSGDPWPKMPGAQARVLVRYLKRMAEDGFTIVTWNGLGFDFSVLAEESGMQEECVALALGHVDPMWHFFCEQGFAVGLNAVALGMGLEGKTEGVGGARAPILWAEGHYQEVMDYVAQDARVTMQVARAIRRRGELCWLTRSGNPRRWCPSSGRLLTVKEAMALPLPEPPSWLDEPWPREHFTAWMIT